MLISFTGKIAQAPQITNKTTLDTTSPSLTTSKWWAVLEQSRWPTVLPEIRNNCPIAAHNLNLWSELLITETSLDETAQRTQQRHKVWIEPKSYPNLERCLVKTIARQIYETWRLILSRGFGQVSKLPAFPRVMINHGVRRKPGLLSPPRYWLKPTPCKKEKKANLRLPQRIESE